MARYRQPQLPGLPLFIPKRKGKAKRVVKQGGQIFRLDRKSPAPLGISMLGNRAMTGKVAKARRKTG